METIATIKATPVYQQILKDSYGGVLYNVDNRGKYDTAEIEALWDSLSDSQRDGADGIIKGVFTFLKLKG